MTLDLLGLLFHRTVPFFGLRMGQRRKGKAAGGPLRGPLGARWEAVSTWRALGICLWKQIARSFPKNSNLILLMLVMMMMMMMMMMIMTIMLMTMIIMIVMNMCPVIMIMYNVADDGDAYADSRFIGRESGSAF